jgi:hypothetical protein
VPRNDQGYGGVTHTVEVTAETLYEAVALGLAAIRGIEWVMGIAQGLMRFRYARRTFPSFTLSS